MISSKLERITRITPPRWTVANGAGATYTVVCNASTTAAELDNTMFMRPAIAQPQGSSPVATPGEYGNALVYFKNADATNTLFISFGPNASVVANSAATAAGNVPWPIFPKETVSFELDPAVDKFFQATTPNGSANTAALVYRLGSFPTQGTPGSG